MKTIYLNVFAFVTLTFIVSCSSNNDFSEDVPQVSQTRMENVINMETKHEKKLSYGLLNENEKRAIWVGKMNSLIDNNMLYGVKIEISKAQKELLSNLKQNLSVKVFSDHQNDEKEYFKNVFVPDFIKKAKKVFDNEYLMGMLFYEISVTPSGKLVSDIENATLFDLIDAFKMEEKLVDQDQKNCDCDKSAFFSCLWGQHEKHCKESKCKKINDCGFAWAWECDGDCKV